MHEFQLSPTYEDAESMADRGVQQLFEILVTRLLVFSTVPIPDAILCVVPFSIVAIETADREP